MSKHRRRAKGCTLDLAGGQLLMQKGKAAYESGQGTTKGMAPKANGLTQASGPLDVRLQLLI